MKNKKTKNKVNKGADKEASKRLGKHFLPVFIAVFLVITVALGTVLGIVSALNNARAAVKYNGVTMDEGTAAYFQGYYKKQFMKLLSDSGVADVIDQPAFWNTKAEDYDKTYGELLQEGCEEYIASIIAANYLFDGYATVSSDIKRQIKESVLEEVNNSTAEGDVGKFDEMLLSLGYGFTYSSMLKAAEMMYKADSVKSIIYGVSGENLSDYSHPDAEALCDEYLNEYAHVKLLIINTETQYKLDENNNKIKGDDGYYETEPLPESIKVERLEDIEEIREHIAAIGTDGEQMSSAVFDSFIEKYEDSSEVSSDNYALSMPDGYYFHKSASYTQNFPEVGSEAVETALSMEIGEYAECTVNGNVCFIYRAPVTAGAYASALAEVCFTDFYSDLADRLYEETLALYTDGVVFTDKYSSEELYYIRPNFEYMLPRF